jgi:hypothetical protein
MSPANPVIQAQLCSRIFYFGEYATHCYGTIVFGVDGRVSADFDNTREAFWRLEGGLLKLLYQDGLSVTATLSWVQDDPLLFHGVTLGTNNKLYLREAISLASLQCEAVGDCSLPVAIVNTAPKSGTYWLQRALADFGFRPTDLHLGNADVDDHRGLARDVLIHRQPWMRRIPLSTSLLCSLLPLGSLTVAHINDLRILRAVATRDCFLVLVVRDLRAIIWSLYRFKLAAVDPIDEQDRHWRGRDLEIERFMGFLSYHIDRDICYIADCFRAFAQLPDVPVFRYEDLRQDCLPPAAEAYLQRHLAGCGGSVAFRAALAASFGQPTPTLRAALPQAPVPLPDECAEIRRLIDAVISGSPLAQVNALFGYA